MKKSNEKGKLRIASLGGLQEIGKNMTVFEYGDDIVVIDAGMGFPDEEMPGVDLVIPWYTWGKTGHLWLCLYHGILCSAPGFHRYR